MGMQPKESKQGAWTGELDARLVAMRDAGKTWGQIAIALDMPESACNRRYERLMRRNPEMSGKSKEIACLQCQKTFRSPDYKKIRRCPRCHHNTDDGAGVFITGASMGGSFGRGKRPAA